MMTRTYRTLRVAPAGQGVLSVVIDAPPMNLIGPELVSLHGELESDQDTRVLVLESARAIHGCDRASRTRSLMTEANPTAWTQATGTGRNTTS
jgi:hypothetical protein